MKSIVTNALVLGLSLVVIAACGAKSSPTSKTEFASGVYNVNFLPGTSQALFDELYANPNTMKVAAACIGCNSVEVRSEKVVCAVDTTGTAVCMSHGMDSNDVSVEFGNTGNESIAYNALRSASTQLGVSALFARNMWFYSVDNVSITRSGNNYSGTGLIQGVVTYGVPVIVWY